MPKNRPLSYSVDEFENGNLLKKGNNTLAKPRSYRSTPLYQVSNISDMRRFANDVTIAQNNPVEFCYDRADLQVPVYIAEIAALSAHGIRAYGLMFAEDYTLAANSRIMLGRYYGSELDESRANERSEYALEVKVVREKKQFRLFKDANKRKSFTAFINHSSSSQHVIFDVTENFDDGCVSLVNQSNDDIHFSRGQQLLVNYGDDFFSKLTVDRIYLSPEDNELTSAEYFALNQKHYSVQRLYHAWAQRVFDLTEQQSQYLLAVPTASHENPSAPCLFIEETTDGEQRVVGDAIQERCSHLMFCAAWGDNEAETAKQLIARGADLNAQTRHGGRSLLHILVECYNEPKINSASTVSENLSLELARLAFVAPQPANPLLKDRNDQSPLYLAIIKDALALFTLMVQHSSQKELLDHLTHYIYVDDINNLETFMRFFYRHRYQDAVQKILPNCVFQFSYQLHDLKSSVKNKQQWLRLRTYCIGLLKAVARKHQNIDWFDSVCNFLEPSEQLDNVKKTYRKLSSVISRDNVLGVRYLAKAKNLMHFIVTLDDIEIHPFLWLITQGNLTTLRGLWTDVYSKLSLNEATALLDSALAIASAESHSHIYKQLIRFYPAPNSDEERIALGAKQMRITFDNAPAEFLESVYVTNVRHEDISYHFIRELLVDGHLRHDDTMCSLVNAYGVDQMCLHFLKLLEQNTRQNRSGLTNALKYLAKTYVQHSNQVNIIDHRKPQYQNKVEQPATLLKLLEQCKVSAPEFEEHVRERRFAKRKNVPQAVTAVDNVVLQAKKRSKREVDPQNHTAATSEIESDQTKSAKRHSTQSERGTPRDNKRVPVPSRVLFSGIYSVPNKYSFTRRPKPSLSGSRLGPLNFRK